MLSKLEKGECNMNEVLNVIMSIVALISMGVFVLFLYILTEEKDEIWEAIREKYNIGE